MVFGGRRHWHRSGLLLGCGWSVFGGRLGVEVKASALTLIFGLEVLRCVLFAGLFVWAVEAG